MPISSITSFDRNVSHKSLLPSCPRKDRIDKIKTPIFFKENEGSTYLQPICFPYRLKVAYRGKNLIKVYKNLYEKVNKNFHS